MGLGAVFPVFYAGIPCDRPYPQSTPGVLGVIFLPTYPSGIEDAYYYHEEIARGMTSGFREVMLT
jgi:hypothetical protein